MRYKQTDELQSYIDWDSIMKMSRYAGGHDDQMKGLFKNVEVIAHWNEGDWQGMVATCVRFTDGQFAGKIAIYNDYYGSCSGCDSWEDASDDEVHNMCIGLSNSAYLFDNIDDVKDFLRSVDENAENDWSAWSTPATRLLSNIEKKIIN